VEGSPNGTDDNTGWLLATTIYGRKHPRLDGPTAVKGSRCLTASGNQTAGPYNFAL